MNTGIYKITNTVNNHCYIGSAVNIKKRWSLHKSDLTKQKHHSAHLQNAWNLYGSDAFQFSILLYCDKKDLLFFEQRAIDTFKPEYNICPVAGSQLGCVRSAETRAKISQSKNGKQLSEEVKQKISQSLKGKQLSEEHKQ